MTTDLFRPAILGGDLVLANRIVMAPLTRSRAGAGDVPGPMNAEYYAQRASAGLIVSEATNISQQGKGYAFTPGIYTEAQVAGWRIVTDAVHAAGGRIFCQLWHVGRISHPSLQPGGGLPVSASAVKAEGQAFTEAGMQDLVTPRALELSEISSLIADYRHAAECAKRAGFDGVEIHAANGYLLEQFLRRLTNHRTDQYGGSVENRVRLLLEAAAAVVEVWGGKRVGIRLSPVSPANNMSGFEDAQEIYEAVVAGIEQLGLCYMHIVEGATQGPRDFAPFDYVRPAQPVQRALHGQQQLRPRIGRRCPCRSSGGPDRLRPGFSQQSGPGGAAAHRRATRARGRKVGLVWRRREGLHGLPGGDQTGGLILPRHRWIESAAVRQYVCLQRGRWKQVWLSRAMALFPAFISRSERTAGRPSPRGAFAPSLEGREQAKAI